MQVSHYTQSINSNKKDKKIELHNYIQQRIFYMCLCFFQFLISHFQQFQYFLNIQFFNFSFLFKVNGETLFKLHFVFCCLYHFSDCNAHRMFTHEVTFLKKFRSDLPKLSLLILPIKHIYFVRCKWLTDFIKFCDDTIKTTSNIDKLY